MQKKEREITTSLVRSILKKSKNIWQLKNTLLAIRTLQRELNNTPIVFLAERFNMVGELKKEVESSIYMHEVAIANLLRPLIAHYTDKIIIADRFWLSKGEVTDGYVLFRTASSMDATHVFLLRNFTDSFNIVFNEGMLYRYDTVSHILNSSEAQRLLHKKQTNVK